MSEFAISVENLGKRYRLGARQEPYYSLRDSLASAASAPLHVARRLARTAKGQPNHGRKPDFWALRGVSLDVKHGEVLGIIGRNGAGKSTLLKLLSEITEPTEGRITVRGRVASLLEVGTGFHPELTGRDNIFLNGAILGMSKAEIARKFDDIVAFAEVEQFIDTQVKHFSSGMYLRLAFAVAAYLEPEILIVDEVLAVGDQAFQHKCLGKMAEVTRGGRTVLLVSHQLAAIKDLCRSVMVLEKGRLAYCGPTLEGLSFYSQTSGVTTSIDLLSPSIHRTGNGRVRITGFHLEDASGKVVPTARVGQPICIVLTFCAEEGAGSVDIGLSLHDEKERAVTVFYSGGENKIFSDIPKCGQFRCYVPKLALTPRLYRVGARVLERGAEADWPRDGVGFFEVAAGDYYGSGYSDYAGDMSFYLDASWQMQ